MNLGELNEDFCIVCGKGIRIINGMFVFHIEFDSSHQATLPPDHPLSKAPLPLTPSEQYNLEGFEKEPVEKLARWYNTLPAEWPEDLPGTPYDWEMLPLEFRRNDGLIDTEKRSKWGFVHDFRVSISRLIGKKPIAHQFWVHQCNLTEDEFEQWWEENKDDFSL